MNKDKIIEDILSIVVDEQVKYKILEQEILVNLLSSADDLSDAGFVELTNNKGLLDYMKTDDFKQDTKEAFKKPLVEVEDVEVLNAMLKSMQASMVLTEVTTKASQTLEDKINSLDFLVEVEGEESPEVPENRVLH